MDNTSCKQQMIPLSNQGMLEQLLQKNNPTKQYTDDYILFFTADWCKACKKVSLYELMKSTPTYTWLLCDVDTNTYSPGFCGVKTIPSFMIIKKGVHSQVYGSSITANVLDWIQHYS